jgi:uracil-DNA glycosylase family 4
LIKAPLAECDKCPLADRPFVPGDGPAKASVAIIGEAPGANEVIKQKPFIGASGDLLNKILESNNIERDKVYVTNACLCRPADNANPSAVAIKCCRARLMEELRSRQPETVLAFGAIAAKSVLGTTTGITKLRTGADYRSTELLCRVVPTFHPAAALRNPDYLPSILFDVGRLSRISVEWEPTRYQVVRDSDTARDCLYKQVKASPLLSLDVENHWEKGWPNDPHNTELLCIGISHRPGTSLVYSQEVVQNEAFLKTLNECFPKTRWLMQNGKFDIQKLWSVGVTNARLDEDTMLAHAATDERKGIHDLETMATELLGAPQYKTDTRKFLPYEGASLKYLPESILHEYNAADTDVTYRIHEKVKGDLIADDVEWAYRNILIPGANVLGRVEYGGIRIDLGALEQLAVRFEGSLADRERELARWVANPRSHVQIKDALAEIGYVVPNTRKETLRDIDTEFTNELRDYKTEHKLLTTYIRGLAKRAIKDRIYTSFNIHVAETGRLSSSNPNLQNIPHDSAIRDLFLPDDDEILVSSDYAAIEARYITHKIQDPYHMRAFAEGRNLNVERAIRIFGPGYTKQQYVWGKNVYYATWYHGTPGFVAHLYDIPVDIVKAVQDDMFRQSPGIKAKFWKGVEQELMEKSYLTSYFGRKRRFWLITPDNWYDVCKQGYNFDPQSSCSDFGVLALIKLEPMLRGKARPVVTVHDALVWSVKRQYLEEVCATIKEVMESVPQLSVPTPVEIQIGESWGSLK